MNAAMRTTLAAIALLLGASAARAQLPPAAELLPRGFKVIEEQNMEVFASIVGTKPNAPSAAGHSEEPIRLAISWQGNPAADQLLELIASQPEEKAANLPGLLGREEPCGKQRHRGGVLTCRKATIQEVGTDAPPVVTLRLEWQGVGSDGLIDISVSHLSGPRATATGWIDAIIPKVTKAR